MPSSARKSTKTITDHVLTKVDLKELQVMMEEAGYTLEKMEEVRQRRRRIQNRNSARMSAERRQGKYDAIAQANEVLQAKLAELETSNAELMRQTEEARQLAMKAAAENQTLQQEIAAMSADLLQLPSELPGAEEFGAVDPLPISMDPLFPWGHGIFDGVQVI